MSALFFPDSGTSRNATDSFTVNCVKDIATAYAHGLLFFPVKNNLNSMQQIFLFKDSGVQVNTQVPIF